MEILVDLLINYVTCQRVVILYILVEFTHDEFISLLETIGELPNDMLVVPALNAIWCPVISQEISIYVYPRRRSMIFDGRVVKMTQTRFASGTLQHYLYRHTVYCYNERLWVRIQSLFWNKQ